jgi:hypothetical protein
VRFILWAALGALALWIYLHRKLLRDLWTHREQISAGDKVVSGAEQAVAGVKDLLKELDL